MNAALAGATSADMSLFVFGLGYTTVGLCSQAAKQGWQVSGTSRTLDRADALAGKGYRIHRYDPAAGHKLGGDALESLHSATHVVTSIPPLALSTYDPVLRDQRALLAAAAPSLRWLGYLSSTGVYGNHDGGWVDEQSEARPCTSKGVVRLEREEAWHKAAASAQLPLHIFRLAGIYGPRRSVVEALQRARPSESQQRRGQQRFTSRCHVHDICQVLLASMAAPLPGSTYNVADDDPAPRTEVMAFAEQLMLAQGVLLGQGREAGRSEPAAQAAQSAGAGGAAAEQQPAGQGDSGSGSARGSRVRASVEEKRVGNAKIKQQLGISLVYPTYRQGVAAVLAGSTAPFDAADLAFLGL